MESIKFITENDNNYLYSQAQKTFLTIHPILEKIINYVESGKTIEQTKKKLQIKYTDNDINYYTEYFRFLKTNSFFKKTEQFFNGRYTAKDLEINLSNINQIIFEVTDNCNLKCEYCGYGKFYGNYDKRKRTKLSFSFAKNYIDFILKYLNSNNNVSYNKPINIGFYGGEPLLNIDLIKKIIVYLKKKNLNNNYFHFGLTTNAILLKKHIDFLVQNDFSILISLDGNFKHSQYRVFKNQQPAFDQIMENVLYVKNKYPDFFEKIRFNAVLHDKNNVDEIYHFFKSKFNKIPQISELHSSGVKDEMKTEFFKTYKNVLKNLKKSNDYELINNDMFIELPETKGLADLIFNHNSFVFDNYSDLILNDKKEIIPTGTCAPFSRRIFLTVNGKILPCEKVGQNFILGQVNNEGVNIDFKKIANLYNTLLDDITTRQCEKCYKKTSCNQCILLLKKVENKHICEKFHNKNKMKNDFSKRLLFFENNPHLYNKIIENVNIR